MPFVVNVGITEIKRNGDEEIAFKSDTYKLNSQSNPEKFPDWERNLLQLVATLKDGTELVNFICNGLGINLQPRSIPEHFQNDSIWGDMATSVSTSPTVTQAPGNSSSSGNSENAAPVEDDPGLMLGITKYSQLSPESKALDSKLYQRLLTLVTGPWSTLLYHVPRPLFSMAMFNLHKNQSMSGFEQKTEAMNGLAKLKFKGNPREFHGNFMGVVQDIYAAQCTIEDFIMMGYLNNLFIYGIEKFAKDISGTIDAVICVDLPSEVIEEKQLKDALKKQGIALIKLITPTTSDDRIKKIVQDAEGFIYSVNVEGQTGVKSADINKVNLQVENIKKYTNIPVVSGFGIKNEKDVKIFSNSKADGIVLGSAIVNEIKKKNSETKDKHIVAKFINDYCKNLIKKLN